MLQWLERSERSLSESESRSAGLKERAARTLWQVFTPSLPSKSMRVKIVKPSVPMDGWKISRLSLQDMFILVVFSEPLGLWCGFLQRLRISDPQRYNSPSARIWFQFFIYSVSNLKVGQEIPGKILIIVNQLRKLWIKDKQHEGQGQIFYKTQEKNNLLISFKMTVSNFIC